MTRPTVPLAKGAWRRVKVWHRWWFEIIMYPAQGDPVYNPNDLITGWDEWKHAGHGFTLRGTMLRAIDRAFDLEVDAVGRAGYHTVEHDPVAAT